MATLMLEALLSTNCLQLQIVIPEKPCPLTVMNPHYKATPALSVHQGFIDSGVPS